MSTMEDTLNKNEPLVEVLSDERVQAAVVTALEKLPSIMEQYAQVEQTLEFVKNFANDKESVQNVLSGLKSDLPDVSITRDTLNAMMVLVDKLPKLVETITALEPMVEFVQAILSDRDSLQNLVKGAEDLIRPTQQRVQEGLSIMEEAKSRAATDRTQVGIFSLLKLLKDPNVQYGIHFMQAVIAVIGERKSK